MHQARGRASNRQMTPACASMRSSWYGPICGFGPTLAAEVLFEEHGVKVGWVMLRRWLIADGLWLSRKQRRTFHQASLPKLQHRRQTAPC